jgi:hypothetical protein
MQKFCIVSLSALFIATPAIAAENFNAQLAKAVCRQQWWRAVRVIDKMTNASEPQFRRQLRSYRTRLVRIAQSGAPARSPVCASDGLPRSGLPDIQLNPASFPPPQ